MARLALALSVVVLTAWGLTHAALGGIAHTRKNYAAATARQERATFDYFNCIEARIRVMVAHGERVFIAAHDDATYQRLTELATPWTRVVPVRSQATAALSLGPAQGAASCGGTGLFVSPP